MTLEPILTATPLIQAHILVAIPAIVIGPFALFRKRRDTPHKVLGYAWVTSMAALALTGLLIPSEMALILHFGPIHLLSFFTLWGIFEGVQSARRRQFVTHQKTMQQIWFGAIGAAGFFALAPGRTMSESLFGATTPIAWVAVAIGLAAIAMLWRHARPYRA